MFCKRCGIPLEETVETCPNCGTDLTDAACKAPEAEAAPEAVAETVPEIVPEVVPEVAPAPVSKEDQLPPQNRPLSGWAYFGLKLLFAAPIVGFVFLIVFSFSRGNINRRNFARSYWCGLLVTVIVLAVLVLIVYGFAFNLRLFIPKQY